MGDRWHRPADLQDWCPAKRVFAACDPNRPQTSGYNHVFVSNTMAGARAVAP